MKRSHISIIFFLLMVMPLTAFARNRFEFDVGVGWPTKYVLNENISDESIIDKPYDGDADAFVEPLKHFVSSVFFQFKYSFIAKEKYRLKGFVGGDLLNFTLECDGCRETQSIVHSGVAFAYGNPFEIEVQLGWQYSDYDHRKPHGADGVIYGLGLTYFPKQQKDPDVQFGFGFVYQRACTRKDDIKTLTDVLMFKLTLSPN